VLATSPMQGFVECVPEVETLQEVQRETVLKYGVSLIVGHAHRPQHTSVPVVGPTGHHTRGCWGLGCLVPVGRVGYLRQPSGWTQGWGVAMVSDNGEFDVHHVNLTRGRVRWHNGKTYGQNGRVTGSQK
jgi:hypothetical protein